jgi:hypothetical protein
MQVVDCSHLFTFRRASYVCRTGRGSPEQHHLERVLSRRGGVVCARVAAPTGRALFPRVLAKVDGFVLVESLPARSDGGARSGEAGVP